MVAKSLRAARQRVADDTRHEMYRAVCDLLRYAGARGIAPRRRMLDIGCHDGQKTMRIANALGIPVENITGIDLADEYLLRASQHFKTVKVDLEAGRLPLDDETFEVVICDQVFEHIKNIHCLMDEIHRIVKTGGYAIIGVPNLAAWHNRVLMLLGRQPICVDVLSSHVRGFAPPAVRELVTFGGRFRVVRMQGYGIYPMPPSPITSALSRRLPTLSPYMFFLCLKASRAGVGLLRSRLEPDGRVRQSEPG